MRSWKKIIAALLILALAGGSYGWYQYQKAPPDIRKEKGGIEITAIDLLKEFQQNETASNTKYVDKVLVVTGMVTEVQTDSSGQSTVYLQTNDLLSAVTCSFYQNDESINKVKAGSPARIKGVCTGMLSDVVLNKCSLAE
ncbi:hypothetical protein [Niastella sp. OAS944]|uniref:OB-fold protein n=1 Tax=Niastella sp. OAS944 TaxID=2664089 RepID=UPI00347D751E|nr:hypothetical protein [Chitinophagaceae bacterium OAS944]